MSDFNTRKFDYPIYYNYIGLRVHGMLRGIAVFKQYWYGRRVDRCYTPTNRKLSKQISWRVTFYNAIQNWKSFDLFTKNFYNRDAEKYRLYGIHRYLTQYLKAQSLMIIYWGTLEKGQSDNASPDAYISSDRFQGVQKLLSKTDYPAGFPYGAAFYHSTLDKILGLYKTGWKEMTGGAGAEAFPVGSIFISIDPTNPGTTLGYGTWAAFGAGKVLVGLDSGDANFDTVEETGGAKTVQSSAQTFAGTPGNTSQADAGVTARGSTSSTLTLKAHVHPFTPAGTNTPGAATSVVQPYIVVYMWKRTA
jgi:hypothetical protein